MGHYTQVAVKKRASGTREVSWSPVFLLLLFLCLGCQGVVLAPSPSSETLPPTPTPLLTPFGCGTLPDEQCAFAWFDTLGYPDLHGTPYVRVATGRWQQTQGQARENTYIRAFLLADEGTTFTVLTTELATSTFTKTMPGMKEYEHVGYEALDMRTDVVAYLEEMTQKDGQIDFNWLDRQLGVRAELLVIARACAANGLNDLADQVYAFATAQADPHTGKVDRRPFHQVAADEIAYVTIWRNTLAFGDPTVPRQELLRRFEQFIVNFPESVYLTQTEETAILLRQMVTEDEVHARQSKPFEEMTQEEQIAELIFQLRDQNGYQWSQPGACDVFLDPRGEDSPAAQLVKTGFPAVPQLIEALEDTRFTRSVGYWRNFTFSHHVLRVGDAALAILERIAGRSFYVRNYTNAQMTKDEETAAVKAEVEAWWQGVLEKGEEQVLIEAVETGDQNSPYQARQLADKYPDVALQAITIGLTHAESYWVHSELVAIAATLEGDAPVPLLLSIIESAPYLSSRVAAAEGLHTRGRDEGVAAMIREWKTPGPVSPTEFDPQARLIEFLASCGDPEAVRTLGKNLSTRSIADRITVVSVFRARAACSFSSMGFDSGNTCLGPAFGDGQYPSREVAMAIEDLLVQALDDPEEAVGASGFRGNKPFQSPRVCDLAGQSLADRWPDRYEFDLAAPLSERDRLIVELKNSWRQDRGQPALPPLPQAEVAPVPDEVAGPHLHALRLSSGPSTLVCRTALLYPGTYNCC